MRRGRTVAGRHRPGVRLLTVRAGLAWLGLAIVVGLGLAIVPAAPAYAHAALVRSDPSDGAVLTGAPGQVTLTFSEPVRAVTDRVRVLGPDSARVDSGTPAVRGAVLTIPLRTGLGGGSYLVSYRVISTDSHPVAGSYTFSVGAPSTNPPTGGETTARIDPVVAVATGAVRYLGYAGLVLLVGPIVVLLALWPRRLSRRAPARLIALGLAAVLLSTIAGMLLQGPYTGAPAREALSGTYGAALAIRLGVLAALAVLLRPVLSERGPSTVDRVVLAILAAVGLVTWPLSGHPAASPLPAASVLADATHLAAASVWLGGLVMLALLLLPRANERELGALLPVWSTWAALTVTALVLTGAAQALIEVRTPGALIGTTYGRLVLAKIGLLALLLAVAAYARRLVRRAAQQAGGPRPLRRTVLAELTIAAVVLGVSAALVQTTPARTAAAPKPSEVSDIADVTLTTGLYSARMEVNPARAGSNTIHLYAYAPGGGPLRVVEWRLTAAPVAGGVEPLTIPLLPITDDHAVGGFVFAPAGQWEVRLTLRLSEVDQATAVQRLTIR